ncbi:MAG: hypothetical protein IT318_21860 [Anaerolineales bacterium]|nr:hypothetical protein [Anaerolineales bacterium]
MSTVKRWRVVWCAGVLLVAMAAGAVSVAPVTATGSMPDPAWQPTPVPTPQYVPTPRPTTGPGPTPTATATPDTPPPIIENIFHIIRFPFQTMMDAVVQMSNKILLQAYREAGQRFTGALDALVAGPYGLAPDVAAGAPTPLFENLVLPHWRVTLAAGLLLLPVTLLLTAVSALRFGATSALGLADLKEALLGWLISAGAAGSSYYLLSLAHRLSVATAGSLLVADFGTRVTGATLAGAFFNVNALLALAGNLLTSPIVLYLAFFGLFLASSIMLGLGLALAAYTALAYLLTTLAPVVLILGSLPPMRWLQALWLKAVVVTFLIPIVDALLLKAVVSLFYNLLSAEGSGDIGTFVTGVFVTAGVVSVLIAINFKVGEAVFGALAEVHRHALDATMGVVKLAAVAVGFAAGGLAVGAAAGAGAGGLGAAGGAAAAGGAPLAGAPSGGAASAAAAASSGTGGASTSVASPGPTASPAGFSLRSGLGGVGRRMLQLLGGQPGGASTYQADPPSDHAAASSASVAEGNSPSLSPESPATSEPGTADASATERPMSQPPANDGQLRRARLAGSFGRALAVGTRNPILQGLGLGLQAGGLAGELRAERTLSGVSPGAAPAEGLSAGSLSGALRWSNRDLSHMPNELFDPGRDNTELMAGGLHQSFVSAGRAVPMAPLLRLANESYGAWRGQGQPGGMAAQRDLFEAMLDPNTKADPETLVGHLETLASRHGFRLAGQIASTARDAFARSQDIAGSDTTSPSTTRRS